MSYEVVSERLSALQDSNSQLRTLIERLATTKYQPGSVPLDDEDNNAMTELTSEIRQILKEQDEDFELLQEDVFEMSPGTYGSDLEEQRNSLDKSVKRAIKELRSCEIAFRKALLSARRNLQGAQRKERELLLQSYLEPPSSTSSPAPSAQQRRGKPTNLSKEDKEVNASSDVTAALRRTHDMMASELSRSQFAHDTLKESTAALSQLSETYSTLDTLLSSSRNLLGTLLRSQKSDTWYLETAFYILVATICWLVWRRILYGPTWWLLWFPMKMFIKGWMGVFAAMGLREGSGIDAGPNSLSTDSLVSSVVHKSAGRISAPSGATMGAPSVNVGGGGKGGPMGVTNTPSQPSDRLMEETISEQVGRIVDASDPEKQDEQEFNQEPTEDDLTNEQRNPKKRMWEEGVEVEKETWKNKDEL